MIRLSEEPMSLEELAEKTGVENKKVYRVLSSLHTSRQIVHFRDDDGVRRYRPVEES
jgi:predicted transcriptional regulator